MSTNYYHQTIALAGIQQSLVVIQDIALQGACNYEDFKTCLLSLFTFNADNYESVYGGHHHLQTGYQALRECFEEKHNQKAQERNRYFAQLLMLSRHIVPQGELSRQIYTTLSMLEGAAQNFDEQSGEIVHRIAQLYQNTLSKFTPRMIIHGEPSHLQSEHNASRIRALLLAGLRGCILWKQAGGTQWSLLFGRRHIVRCTKQALTQEKSD